MDIKLLDTVLENEIKKRKLPGVAVAVRNSDGILFEKGYGVRDEDNNPVTPQTVMGIGSLSKSFVAVALAILADEGKCSFDDSIAKYMPEFSIPGTPVESITLKTLAMHTSGLPPLEPLEWSIACNTEGRNTQLAKEMRKASPNKMNTIEQIMEYVAHCPYPILGAPGEYMSYSNEGYAVLSYVVDKIAGCSLEQFLAERVFAPLGMSRTVLDIDCSSAYRLAAEGNITKLWERDSNGTFTVDDNWSILPPYRGCACIKSTAQDMARYYQCLSNNGILEGKQVLPASVQEIMTGQAFPLEQKPVYCYGLYKRAWKNHTICDHSGGLHGVSTHGGFFRNENCSFIVLCNEGDQDAEDLCRIMYNIYADCEPYESQRWLTPVNTVFSESEMITGSYACHEGETNSMTVSQKDGAIAVRKSDKEYTAVFCGKTDFLCINDTTKNGSTLHFYIRNGKAWGCKVSSRIYTRIE